MSTPIPSVHLWMCQPEGEPEHLLMVQVRGENEGEVVFRPLMATTRDAALELSDIAQDASNQMDLPILLRDYALVPATEPFLDDPDDRPCTTCGCGYPLIWVGGEWQHDCAPWFWGEDHDPNDQIDPPDAEAVAYWAAEDGMDQ